MNQNEAMFAVARAVIPGGADSPVRAYGAVGGTPSSITRAKGVRVQDADNKDYIDLVCSWGPVLLGRADTRVVAAVQGVATRGLSFEAPTEVKTLLAEAVRRRMPLVEKMRFVSTGTEAVMTVIRLARGAIGRDLVVKFAGNYHGHSDGLLSEAGSGVVTGGLPASTGVPGTIVELTIVLPYNDVTTLRECFAARGDAVAGVIVEGTAANMGIVAPQDDFLSEITRLCHENGTLMIQDEVLSGFQVLASRWWDLSTGREVLRQPGAQNSGVVFGTDWTPDLLTFGKVIGGGMPLTALGGRTELMEQLAPAGPVYQAGTLPGSLLSCAAGLATLQAAGQQVYAAVDRVADTVAGALYEALAREGVSHSIGQAGSLFSVFFSESLVVDYAGAKRQKTWRFAPTFWEFHRQGVMLPLSVSEAWFVSAAHLGDDAAMNRILDAIPAAIHAAAVVTPPKK